MKAPVTSSNQIVNEPVVSFYHQQSRNFPDLLKSVLLHDETGEFNSQMVDKFHLSDQQVKAFVLVIQQLLTKTIKPQDVPEKIHSMVLLDEKNSKALACDLLGWRGLPLEWYLGPVQPIIRNLGADPQTYLDRLRPIYPEVFSQAPLKTEADPDHDDPMVELAKRYGTTVAIIPTADILDHFTERLGSFAGRAEILLRLTGLGTELEERAKTGLMDKAAAEKMIADLDAISNAINTRDLNPFEIQALHRRLERMLSTL